jgi:hypothetical protein
VTTTAKAASTGAVRAARLDRPGRTDAGMSSPTAGDEASLT